nr:hypothetical protein CPHELBEB_02842 [Escherichia coli]
MSTQKQLSRTTGTERMFKEELALSLICWVLPVHLPTGPIKSSVVLKFRLKDRQHYWVRLKNSFVLSLMKKATTQEGLLLVLTYVVFHFRRVCSRTLPCLRKRL